MNNEIRVEDNGETVSCWIPCRECGIDQYYPFGPSGYPRDDLDRVKARAKRLTILCSGCADKMAARAIALRAIARGE